jgi:DNA invertase Pin-like site-specific DNA recombinase
LGRTTRKPVQDRPTALPSGQPSGGEGAPPGVLTGHGVRVEFVKESLTFTGDDSPMNTLLLSMLGAIAEFERSMILERQREGIALAKAAGEYKGRKAVLNDTRAAELRARLAKGESVSGLAREYGISRQSVYNYKTA